MTDAAPVRPEPPLRLGTRRSALALAQSGMIARQITERSGRAVELVPIVSEGDVNRASLASIGGTGVFATRLREALRAGECDLLVHSLKDLPTEQPGDLVLAALPEREDARDVLVTRGPSLTELRTGALVGTGSPRRIAQLRGLAPRAVARDLRGNVDSRLQRVRSGELDAVILAAAGLARLAPDLDGLALHPLGLATWPTAAGQGVLAVEVAADAAGDVVAAASVVDHSLTRLAATLERHVLAGLEAGCHAPIGVHAAFSTLGDETAFELRVRAVAYAREGGGRVAIDRATRVDARYIGGEGAGNGAEGGLTAGSARALPARVGEFGADIVTALLRNGAAELVSEGSS